MGKAVFSYWAKLFLEAAKSMWRELGIFGLLFGLLFSGIYAFVIGQQTFSLEGILTFAKVLIVLIAIAWVIFVLVVAATQDKNKEDKINDLGSQLKAIESSKPVIHARNSGVNQKFFAKVWNDAISIDVLNISPGTTAEKVLPTVKWFTMRGKLITENCGRWWMSTEDVAVTKTAERLVMDLLSNGMVYPFHFAIQPPNDQHFYAWYREADGKDGRYALQDKRYKVKIQFQSNNNAVADYVYVVTNDNGKLSIRETKR
jgi:hypothetical protein